MKKKALSLTILGMLSSVMILASCTGTIPQPTISSSISTDSSSVTSSSTSSSSSSSSEVDYSDYEFSISNKDEITSEWLLGAANRQITVTSTPGANTIALILEGRIRFTSSNTDVVSVVGSHIYAQGLGTTKIEGFIDDEKFDECEISVVAQPSYVGATVSDVLEDGKLVTDNTRLYVITAFVVAWDTGNSDATRYGSYYIAEASNETDTSKMALVYSSSANYSDMSFVPASGKYNFRSSNDFLTNDGTKDLGLTDLVTIIAYKTVTGAGEIRLTGIVINTDGNYIANGKMTTDQVLDYTGPSNLLFDVTGVVTAMESENGTEDGKLTIQTEGSTKGTVSVLGCSDNRNSIYWESAVLGWQFVNPHDFLSGATTSTIKVGDTITIRCVVSYGPDNVQAISGRVISVTPATAA